MSWTSLAGLSLAQACGWTLCRYASQPALVANSLRFVIKTRGGFHNTNLSKLSFSHVLICAGLSRFAMRADAPMMWTIFKEVLNFRSLTLRI